MIRADKLRIGDVIKYNGEYVVVVKFYIPEDAWWRLNSISPIVSIDGKHHQLTFWNREKIETKYRTR